MKTTEWFPGHVEPVREGVYQRLNDSTGREFWARWSGSQWYWGALKYEWAEEENSPTLFPQRWPWRGLAQPAKEAA